MGLHIAMALAARSQDTDVASLRASPSRKRGVAAVNVIREANVIALRVSSVAAGVAELFWEGPFGLLVLAPFVPCPFLAALTFALISLTWSLGPLRHASVKVVVGLSFVVAATGACWQGLQRQVVVPMRQHPVDGRV